MNVSKVSYLVLSDIHLGHRKTPIEHIIKNLDDYIAKNHKLFKNLDIIFLAGDVVDRLLSTHSKEFLLVNRWLSRLCLYCSKHNIKLRVLEGTPSHDWKQLSVFSDTIKNLGVAIDYKYIDVLSIEEITDLGISVLYVPDEWNHNADDTYKEVLNLLASNSLSQVDIAIMHGQFKFQIPMVELESSHDEDSYLSIVKYYINIGHIHTSMCYNRILGQGSFDRLAHNEEEDKGGMVMTIYHTGDMEYKFIKNPNAYPYITYDLSKNTIKDITKFLNKKLNKLKSGSRVRLIVSNNEVISILKPLRDMYKNLYIDIVKVKQKQDVVVKDNRVVIEPFDINKSNILDLIIESASTRLTSDELEVLKVEVTGAMSGVC